MRGCWLWGGVHHANLAVDPQLSPEMDEIRAEHQHIRERHAARSQDDADPVDGLANLIVATAGQPGQPVPEGIRQDGTDFLNLPLVRRQDVIGGK